MKKFFTDKKKVTLVILLAVGIITIVFGKTLFVQGGITLFCWSLAVFTAISINNDKNIQDLIAYDEQAKLILIDIEENGEESEYYTIYNLEILNAIRAKEVKKQNKQRISCTILGVVLMIVCFVCLF